MKILGHNLLPFTVAQLPSNWTIGLDIEAYFFEGNIPTDLTSYITDHRNLFGNCIAANRIILKPTTEGLMLLQEYSYGFKAVSGSVYDPKLGVTIHYPKNMIPRTYSNSNVAVDIQTAYNLGMDSGNKKLKQNVSLSFVNGFPIAVDKGIYGNPLLASTFYASQPSCANFEYENSILFDAIVSDDATKPSAASFYMSNMDSAGTPAVGTEVLYTLPANVAANQNTATITSSKVYIRGDAQNFRRIFPATVGDVHTTPVTKTIGWALLVFVDSNLNNFALGLKDVRVMATKVGLLESGELIELASLDVSTGQFAEVLQVRTATVYQPITAPVDPTSYAAFVSAASGLVSADRATQFSGVADGNIKTQLSNTAFSGSMWGSTYGTLATNDSYIDRGIQHAFPSSDIANENLSNSRLIVAEYFHTGTVAGGFNSVTRNGYTSNAYGSYVGCSILDFIYFDYTLNKMMRCNPNAGTAPVAWDGTFL